MIQLKYTQKWKNPVWGAKMAHFVVTATLYLHTLHRKPNLYEDLVGMGMMDASASGSSSVVLCNPFKWDILLFILINNHVVCVPSTIAKWISFYNHRNRKVVKGKHNVLVLYVDACVPDPFGVVLCNPFIWDILLFILIKNLVVCVPSTPVKWISFHNHRNRKVVRG